MSKFQVNSQSGEFQATPTGTVRTVAEFEALLERLKVQNPVRFQMDTDSGYFDAFRKTLVDYVAPVVKVQEEPTLVPVEEPAPEEIPGV